MMNLEKMGAVVLTGLVLAGVPVLAATNLIGNADLSLDDGTGDPVGWNRIVPRTERTDLAIDARPLGDGVFEIAFFGSSRMFFRQGGITLKPGAPYRLSGEVKTFGLGSAQMLFWLWNTHWKVDCKSELFPADTKGGWKTVSLDFTAPASEKLDDYTFSICGTGSETVAAKAHVRNMRLVALTEEGEKASAPPDPKNFRPLPTRIVPIDPLLADISAKTGVMTFYWGGAAKTNAVGARLEADFLGKTAAAAFDASECRAKVAFGPLKAGARGSLRARVVGTDGTVLREDAYPARVKPFVKGGPTGVRLNNFVTRLVDKPLENGDAAFYRAEEGWVWISFEGLVGSSARGYLDGFAMPVVLPRDGERRLETQRYVTAGWHTLTVEGAKPGGRLRIHAVPPIFGNPPRLYGRGTPIDVSQRYDYSLAFAQRFDGLSVFNTLEGSSKPEHGGLLSSDRPWATYYRARGMRLYDAVYFSGPDLRRADADVTFAVLTNSLWSQGHDIVVDENQVEIQRICSVNYGEAVWRMIGLRPGVEVGTFLADSSFGAFYRDPRNSASELSAIVNSGDGKGLIYAEVYAPTLADEAESRAYEDKYARLLKSVSDLVPAANGKVHLYMGSWIRNGIWNSYTSPQVDIKAHVSDLMRAFATRPEFAANAGVSFGGASCGEEEIRRWAFRCLRYYALEGGTGDLAKERGFTWQPGFVKNCDFDDGLEGWTAEAAEGGSVAAEKIPNFGARVEERKQSPPGVGDGLAVFTTSEKGPNSLSQRLSGLKPGGCYSLQFTYVDYDTVARRTAERRPMCLSVRLDGGAEVQGLTVRQEARAPKYPKGAKEKVQLTNCKFVFRADASDATLVFTDRDETGLARPAGTKQAINYIVFRPYYLENEGDLEDLVRTFAGENAG